ncbi:MAG TPA: ABC transporter ATP-binding protein [Stellaceae bacterium]|nr:ABC transporter ATP-binding protein [Stellaceae bacterium]
MSGDNSLTLAIDDLVAGYGATVVLDGVSFTMPAGGTLAVLGRNGVGKTTLLATLMGFTNRHRGTIRFGDRSIETMASHRRNRAGFGYVPQEREIFPSLSVEENLLIARRDGGWTLDAVYDLFPALKERRHNSGNRLSGGEQQMLAVGRALVGAPKLLLLDEPTEGLAPIVVDALSDTLARIRDESSLSIVLVEQRVDLALSFARDAIVLDRGRIVWRGISADLQADEATKHRLFGVAG